MTRNWLIIFTLLLLASCSGERCIDADDFGHAKFTVSSRYDAAKLDSQVGDNQVAPWLNSEYRVNGRPLTITVKGWDYGVDNNNSSEVSAWCPWFGTSIHENILSDICVRLTECIYANDTMCTTGVDAAIINAPCLMKKGVGLYALLAEEGSDPNLTLATQANPKGLVFHVGEKTADYAMYEVDLNGNLRETGGRVYNFITDEAKSKYYGSNIYFKILDKFYDDNNGQYRVIVKSGISRLSPDPITYSIKIVKDFIFGTNGKQGVIKDLYMGVVNNRGYKLAVSGLLTLYIVFTVLSYLMGNIKMNQTELIIRVTKIAIISALLNSQYSWSFFNDYLFVFFVGGAEQILNIISEAGASGPGATGIMAMMIAPQTTFKLLSVLFTDWLGFIYIILFFVATCLVVLIYFKSAVIYLSALIAISILIIMAPIFISFYLFEFTKPFFENWLKQLISYTVQPIILFTGLIFISMLIMQELYASLGFGVCRYNFLSMSSISPTDGAATNIFDAKTQDTLNGLTDSIFSWWFPQRMLGTNFTRELKPIPIPIDHFENELLLGDNSQNTFCEAYGCIGERYPDLPFLDPVKDLRRLTQFWSGNFVQLDGLFLIFVAIYLLHKFNALTVQTAKYLTGTTENSVKINNIGNTAVADFKNKISSITNPIKAQVAKLPKRALNVAIGRERSDALVAKVKEKLTTLTPSYLIDQARVKALKSESLGQGANKAVLDEVRINTGLDQSSIKKNAIPAYKEALKKELLKDVDTTLPQAKREQIAKKTAAKLAKKDPSQLKNEFSKMKFGKEFAELSDAQKSQIKEITKNKELKVLARDSAKARKFREAYVDAYIGLSDKGVGIVGKHNKAIRSVEELQHDIKEMKKNHRGLYAMNDKQFSNELMSNLGNPNNISTKKSSNNFRKQTDKEIAYEGRFEKEKDRVNNAINVLSKKQGENVITPEFITKISGSNNPNAEIYKNLERKDLNNKIYDALRSGDKPALLGDHYMSKYAKDSELRASLDQIAKIEKNFIKNDDFIDRKNDHKVTFDLAMDKIKADHQVLKEHYKMDNIKPQEMPALMQKYYEEKALTDPKNAIPKNVAQKKVEDLKAALQEADSSKKVLEHIEARKDEVHKVIDVYVNKVNAHRKNSGMDEYQPKRKAVKVIRRSYDIEKLMKK